MTQQPCPYGMKSTDPNYCDKCQRCTKEGWKAFMTGKHRIHQPVSKKRRMLKGESPYSRFWTGKKRKIEKQRGIATLMECELTQKSVWITDGMCDIEDTCLEENCLLKEQSNCNEIKGK